MAVHLRRRRWRCWPARPATSPSPPSPAPALHEYLLDAGTGVAVWSTDTQILGSPVVVRKTDTIALEGNGDYDLPALLVDRSIVDGTWCGRRS